MSPQLLYKSPELSLSEIKLLLHKAAEADPPLVFFDKHNNRYTLGCFDTRYPVSLAELDSLGVSITGFVVKSRPLPGRFDLFRSAYHSLTALSQAGVRTSHFLKQTGSPQGITRDELIVTRWPGAEKLVLHLTISHAGARGLSGLLRTFDSFCGAFDLDGEAVLSGDKLTFHGNLDQAPDATLLQNGAGDSISVPRWVQGVSISLNGDSKEIFERIFRFQSEAGYEEVGGRSIAFLNCVHELGDNPALSTEIYRSGLVHLPKQEKWNCEYTVRIDSFEQFEALVAWKPNKKWSAPVGGWPYEDIFYGNIDVEGCRGKFRIIYSTNSDDKKHLRHAKAALGVALKYSGGF